MDTRGKMNTEFRNEVSEILAQHESRFDLLSNNVNQVSATLQTVLIELQALLVNSTQPSTNQDVNPFAIGGTSHNNQPPFKPMLPLTETTMTSSCHSLNSVGKTLLNGFIKPSNTSILKT